MCDITVIVGAPHGVVAMVAVTMLHGVVGTVVVLHGVTVTVIALCSATVTITIVIIVVVSGWVVVGPEISSVGH